MKASSFILFFLLITSQIFSQPVVQQWVARYNGTSNSNDYTYALALDPSSNVIVTGYSTNVGTSKDMTTIKYDQSGNTVWARTYDGPNHGGDYSFAVTTDQSGNVYVTGRCDGGATNADITSIKYSPAGDQLWVAVYDGPAHNFDEGRCISVDNSGNVYVSGTSMGLTSGQDIVLIKYNSDGIEQWVQRYNGPGNGYDCTNSMVINSSSDIYIAGTSVGIGDDYVVLKYSTTGVPLWNQRYNGPGNGMDVPVAIKLDAAENVYVAGYSDGGTTLYDYATLKYNSAGVQQWLRRYNSPSSTSDFATAMAVNSAGDVYVTGITLGTGALSDSNFATVKYNSNGDFQWVVNYEGQSNSTDVPRAICLDNLGNIYVSGSSALAGSFNDYLTIKYDHSGSQIWLQSYNGPANSDDYSASNVVDNSGNFYVTGRSTGINTGFDFATVKYTDIVGIQPLTNEVPSKFSLSQNYPNPFNPTTNIKFDIPVSSFVTLKIFNIIGKEVMTPIDQTLSPGSYEVSVNAANLASGIYFYRINAGSFIDTKRMILVK